MPDLSILCVTRAEPCVLPLLRQLAGDSRSIGAEFTLVADGREAETRLYRYQSRTKFYPDRIFETETKGYIESVLDACINLTTGRYVFRIDDDESIPPPLVEWLRAGAYKESDHWKFNRAHLIREVDTETGIEEITVLTTPPLWPDHQTRFSTRDKSFGRTHIHCGSPHGGGDLCPYPIIHHKFVIKSREEREEIVKRYESVQPGAGSGFRHFSVPEMVEEEGGRLETISYDEFVQRGYTA